jgi:hypothetical protein
MPPSEAEILAARLARMKALIGSLEDACSETAEQRDTFLKLKPEMEAARLALQVVKPVEPE